MAGQLAAADATPDPPPTTPTGSGRRSRRRFRPLVTLRPWLLSAVAAAVVVAATLPDYHPGSPRVEYLLRAAVVLAVVTGAAGWWWTQRHGRGWGPDLAPAVVGGIAGLALLVSLHRTPYALGGLEGDQTFRTAAVTRFADSWQLTDFTFAGLPSFYAPAYFWVLGRVADLAGTEPWRMLKVGTVAVALLVPVAGYLLWRRLVPDWLAAALAVVPLLAGEAYEPYSWLVLIAIVPWWLLAVADLRRPDRPPPHPVWLGLLGAVLFLTYYYFFFIAGLALLLYLAVERVSGRLRWRDLHRPAVTLVVAAAGAAVFWLPLAVSMVTAGQVESLANRWFGESHPTLPLPMLEASATGALSLLGAGYLVWTIREPLSRGLTVLLAAAYGWYLIGALAAAADSPLLSFRGKALIPLVLLLAGGLGAARLARWAAGRHRPADVWRTAAVATVLLAVFAGQTFVTGLRENPHVTAAHASALPDGRLPPHHPADAEPPAVPAAEIHSVISEWWGGPTPPVLLSDRVDVLALYPYHGFLQWNAHYAHPAAGFHARATFLRELAAGGTPAGFAHRTRHNPYDPVDAFLLRVDGDELVFGYSEDNFPDGVRPAELRFPRALFTDRHFELVPLGDHLLALRRG